MWSVATDPLMQDLACSFWLSWQNCTTNALFLGRVFGFCGSNSEQDSQLVRNVLEQLECVNILQVAKEQTAQACSCLSSLLCAVSNNVVHRLLSRRRHAAVHRQKIRSRRSTLNDGVYHHTHTLIAGSGSHASKPTFWKTMALRPHF